MNTIEHMLRASAECLKDAPALIVAVGSWTVYGVICLIEVIVR